MLVDGMGTGQAGLIGWPGYTVPQNRAVGAQFRFQADSSVKNVQLG